MATDLSEVIQSTSNGVVEERRGRPIEIADDVSTLRPEYRRVAMMRLAGMTEFAIAQYLEITAARVNQILHRPDVQRHMMKLDATFVDDVRPAAERVNQALESASLKAQRVVEEVMEEMHKRDELKAKSLAMVAARDILDRAGHRPSLRVEGRVAHGITINPEQLEHALEVIKETK